MAPQVVFSVLHRHLDTSNQINQMSTLCYYTILAPVQYQVLVFMNNQIIYGVKKKKTFFEFHKISINMYHIFLGGKTF